MVKTKIILDADEIIHFALTRDAMKEFALLTRTLGRGESACMVYCKYNQDVIGSSNVSHR
ncbi:MAG: hypothetical protein ACRCX4_02375 [Bacteroidales bacterium]